MEQLLTFAILGAAVIVVLGSSRAPQGRAIGIWVAASTLVTLLLPSALDLSTSAVWADGSSISIDDDRMSVQVSDGDRRLRMRADAEFRFNDAEDGIAFLAPGGHMDLEQRIRRHEVRALAVDAARDGTLSFEYRVDREVQPYDAAAQAWLAQVIPDLLRATGMQAEARVARILDRGGVDAVLAEIERIDSDHVQGIYFAALATQAETDGATLARVLDLTGRQIGSDFELRQTLTTLAEDRHLDEEGSLALLGAAHHIGSDFELAELLVASVSRIEPSTAVADAYLTAAREIGSDFEMRRALSALVTSRWADQASPTALFDTAAQIGSDFELAEMLIDATPLASTGPEASAAFLRACATLGSDYEMGRVLTALVRRGESDHDLLRDVLRLAARDLGSDHERSQLLIAAAGQVRGDPELRDAYQAAARGLGDYQYGQVMRALGDAE